MTPRAFDPEVVQNKLRHINRLLSALNRLGDVDAARLESDEVVRHASEWILTQVAQLAASAASYIVVRIGDEVPATYADAFRLLKRHEVIDKPLADRLQQLAGMRNLLIHRYDDIDLARLAEGLAMVSSDGTALVRRLTEHIQTALGEEPGTGKG